MARLTALHPGASISVWSGCGAAGALDHPERKLPPVIHVAGTNGKGSTMAYLRAILEAGCA
jgi:dihydrofolate synthase/folylpolyglutamate synthase